ncbi:hypothetical protein [Kribbella soli]|uniref:Uncharacterized protein n=1 Tax=Kribbella soli TaxID=1124743 RepID=A0A4R0HB65_9ACTN|nr:hypothetical protein [Kribbella soli]TCC08207.1 hypothetical protein E0H45_20075 [Kribbella soli]
MTAGEDRGRPIAATRQVVEMFATEALLALDKYERSLPADATDRGQQTADRLAHWWKQLKMDDALRGGGGTDAEQILAKAADLALDPHNHEGLRVEDAAAQAKMMADFRGRPTAMKDIADFRREFGTAYGGTADVPASGDEWLAQSLTRLARASLLRDVVTRGAKAELSRPLRDAADELVQQGQKLMDGQDELAVRQQMSAAEDASYRHQVRLVVGSLVYAAGVTASGAPDLAQAAMLAPAAAVAITQTVKSWNARQNPPEPGLDPAQAQLRSVRTDLTNTLDTPTPATRRDTRAIRNATTRRPDHGR